MHCHCSTLGASLGVAVPKNPITAELNTAGLAQDTWTGLLFSCSPVDAAMG